MHWYTLDGKPMHYVRARNGFLRGTTLRDARALNLLPSVSEVLAVIAKPGLERWKLDQSILAALTLPKRTDEPDAAYLARIRSDASREAREAAQEGTRIHKAIERSFLNRSYPDAYRPHVDAVHAKLAELFPGVTDWQTEQTFGDPRGFGGCCDLHSPSTGIVVDFKGANVGPEDDKRLAYDQHRQLAAYREGLHLPAREGANLFVSRTHPGHVRAHVWSTDEMQEGWEIFRAALHLWRCMHKHYPGGEG